MRQAEPNERYTYKFEHELRFGYYVLTVLLDGKPEGTLTYHGCGETFEHWKTAATKEHVDFSVLQEAHEIMRLYVDRMQTLHEETKAWAEQQRFR